MFTSLLVGLDGSSHAEVALSQAILIGQRFHSRVVLAHVAPPAGRTAEMSLGAPWMEWVAGHSPVTRHEHEDAARKMLEDSAGAVRRAGLEVETAWRTGEVASELRELSDAVGVVVVGRKGHKSGASEDFIGPDTRALLRRSDRPLLVCGSIPTAMDRVLLAYSGSAASEAALAFASRFVGISNARLDVLQLPGERGKRSEVSGRASSALSQALIDFELHLAQGDPSQALLDAATRLGTNVVFIAAERDEGQWLVPPPAEAIFRATDLPVLVHFEPASPVARTSGSNRGSAP